MRERLLPLLILLTCIAALSLAAGGARAGDGALAAGFVPLPSAALPVPPAAMPALPVAPSVVAGLMAFIDPETGRLTGPIGQLQVPQDQLQSYVSLESLVPVTLPDGSVMLDLRGALQD